MTMELKGSVIYAQQCVSTCNATMLRGKLKKNAARIPMRKSELHMSNQLWRFYRLLLVSEYFLQNKSSGALSNRSLDVRQPSKGKSPSRVDSSARWHRRISWCITMLRPIMTNETFSGISDELRVGVCSTVDSLHLIASTLALGINGLLLFVCFRRPFAVLITRLAANDFLVGAIGDTTSAKDEFYCVKNQNGETYFDRIMDYFVDNSAAVLVVALSVEI